MPAVVLVGHDHACPTCGPVTVASGSGSFTVNGRAVARAGDTLSCGAVIISGSPSMIINDKAVARVGDTTDHEGVLENGDDSWLIN
ncbi:hypothetical protein EKA85_26780 [Pseudomonas veronii]|uniref:PAAR domain-containing protein n=1 Tax=Pseudomonas TaxID=286 RepID=UPI000F83B1E2|nr:MULTISPECIES: PAAR domain-containing protein [Pseudomonas]MDY7552566.1 PAAR domain-containing protein [Pseudomonas sp. FG1]MEB0052040.1 PAAR domain-containing protein [Pseudomonas sp. FG1]RTY61901.1 hypothetical protein EKA85_26780 [Pseudomonas veronii]